MNEISARNITPRRIALDWSYEYEPEICRQRDNAERTSLDPYEPGTGSAVVDVRTLTRGVLRIAVLGFFGPPWRSRPCHKKLLYSDNGKEQAPHEITSRI